MMSTSPNKHKNQSNSLFNTPAREGRSFPSMQKSDVHTMLPQTKIPGNESYFLIPAHAFEDRSFNWTSLDTQESQLEAYQKLCANIHGLEILSKNKYRMDPYMKLADLKKYRKCLRCSQRNKTMKAKKNCNYHLDPICLQDNKGGKYHACCGRLATCQAASEHKWEDMTPEFEDRFASFIETPRQNTTCMKRKAVVVDCEMIGVSDGFSELARLCAVDYLTGETLIYCFVDPVEQVVDYRTPYSGITAKNMATAKANGNCLSNWSAARDALLQFVDAKTIMIGSGFHNDLEILRLVHTNVVDSSLVCHIKVGQRLGLRTLCKEMLNLDIHPPEKSHNPLEDCMATREIVLWMTYAGKSKLDEWIVVTKRRVEEERERQRQHQIDQRNEREHNPEDVVDTRFVEEIGADGLTGYQRFLREAYG